MIRVITVGSLRVIKVNARGGLKKVLKEKECFSAKVQGCY